MSLATNNVFIPVVIMRKTLIGTIFLFNYLFLILDFNYSSFFIKSSLHNYLLRANRRLSKRGAYLLNLSSYFSVTPNTQSEILQYLKPKKYYLFYVTLVSLFLTIGVLDIFFSSNSAFSLMVYLLSIVLVLLLVLYGAPLVLDAIDELESHLVSFSSIKNKSLTTTITLLKVSLGLKINSNLSFFNV